MPKLWTETIDAHRTAVRDATLDATAALVAQHGLAGVTMSQIAKETGIGRATLYKYYPDVQAIMVAWHERHIAAHLDQLAAVRDRTPGTASQRLEAVLTTYAQLSRQQQHTELAALLHRGERIAHAQQHLRQLITDLIAAGGRDGDLRNDVAPAELATFCLHALTAAGNLPSQAAVRRLISVTLTGLRPVTPTTAPAPSR